MPEIDLLDYLHDHYDHLDYATIKALMPKVKRVVTPLASALASALLGNGCAIIDEVDWNQTIKISDELTVHALPARHFSGRAETQPDLMGQLPVRHPAGKDLLQRR